MPDSIDEYLRRFVGPGSMKFFNITYLNTSFLHEPVVSLERNSHYHEAKRTVVNLAVTNDAAKRVVKLCADFKSSGRKIIFKLFCRQWRTREPSYPTSKT